MSYDSENDYLKHTNMSHNYPLRARMDSSNSSLYFGILQQEEKERQEREEGERLMREQQEEQMKKDEEEVGTLGSTQVLTNSEFWAEDRYITLAMSFCWNDPLGILVH